MAKLNDVVTPINSCDLSLKILRPGRTHREQHRNRHP